jgi:hypothetical protein
MLDGLLYTEIKKIIGTYHAIKSGIIIFIGMQPKGNNIEIEHMILKQVTSPAYMCCIVSNQGEKYQK